MWESELRLIEQLWPHITYVASAEPLDFIHKKAPEPCGFFHKKETTAVRCAERNGLPYVCVMVKFRLDNPGWMVWKKHKSLADFKADLTKVTSHLEIAKIRLLCICEDPYPFINEADIVAAATDYKSLFHERDRLIAANYLRIVE